MYLSDYFKKLKDDFDAMPAEVEPAVLRAWTALEADYIVLLKDPENSAFVQRFSSSLQAFKSALNSDKHNASSKSSKSVNGDVESLLSELGYITPSELNAALEVLPPVPPRGNITPPPHDLDSAFGSRESSQADVLAGMKFLINTGRVSTLIARAERMGSSSSTEEALSKSRALSRSGSSLLLESSGTTSRNSMNAATQTPSPLPPRDCLLRPSSCSIFTLPSDAENGYVAPTRFGPPTPPGQQLTDKKPEGVRRPVAVSPDREASEGDYARIVGSNSASDSDSDDETYARITSLRTNKL